ncbi:MAG: sarcosine oxidase subunit alpha family protein [Hyphomicrobiaceae bacterium]
MTESQPFRNAAGGLVDREQKFGFRFDGKSYGGFAGDTLASALLANGVRLVGRSFKYHRPRGILTAGSEEPNALVELRVGGRREPNSRATVVELFHGLEASSQNRWPSLDYDLLSVNSLFSPIFVAGFYYKTFKWPPSFWEPVYERIIRRAAGLGRAALEHDPDHYEKAHAHCDVLVIGAGPAGLMAGLAAGRAGARVIIANEGPTLGGALLGENISVDGKPGFEWVAQLAAEFEALDNVQIMPRTTIFGRYDGGVYGAVEHVSDHVVVPSPHNARQRLWRIYSKQAVLAGGATERGIVFAGNDRPGVIHAQAARTYANRYAVRAGERAVVFGSTDDVYRTAHDLAEAGIEVAAIVDARSGTPERNARFETFRGYVVSRALGGRAVRAAEVRKSGDDYALEQIPCDLICVAGGWTPNIQIATHLGQRPVFDEDKACFLMPDETGGLLIAGSAAGHWGTDACLKSGTEKGAAAAGSCGFEVATPGTDEVEEGPYGNLVPLYRVKSKLGKAFVDLQNDVTDKDVALAVSEGYDSAEHTKRYTTLGMATDQGKTGNINGAAVMAEALGEPIAEVGITTARPPYTPVSFGALVGHSVGKHFSPYRLTPMHEWHEDRGATFIETGLWLRAQFYPEAGDSDWLDAARREVEATRSSVGICDVSTLGKIDIQGPDAAELLNRLYINGWLKLAVGKARYGLMLREDGFVMDDGTTSRLSENHYVMTTTTANAGGVMSHIEFCHQVLWPQLDVQYVSVTEQWAQMAVAGPRSREVLQGVIEDTDLSNEAFPFMAAREVSLMGGVRGRLFRISFSGELAYELAVPADYGMAAWQAIMTAGAAHNIAPYGLEALSIMRVEKGHPAGPELDGRTTAGDLGLGRMMSQRKEFIGRVMAGRPALVEEDRPRLVGLKPVNAEERPYAGAHLLPEDVEHTASSDQGWVSSTAFSPSLGQWIGIGFIKGGQKRAGEQLIAAEFLRGSQVKVEVVDPVFVDPKGEKLHA